MQAFQNLKSKVGTGKLEWPASILRGTICLLILLLLQACTPPLKARFATAADIQRQAPATVSTEQRSANRAFQRSPCFDWEAYVPDTANLEHTPMRYLRINFHFVNSADSSQNYVGEEARKLVRELLSSAQNDVDNNNKMWLPMRNETPVLPLRYRYVLTGDPNRPGDDGIYTHFDDEVCFYVHKGAQRNLSDRRVIERYAVRPDSILNVFILPHHPDSVDSPTYSRGSVGVALGSSIKLAGIFENGGPGWNYRGVFNHEVGHVLGLSHSWVGDDGCDDTPRHPGNCWNRSSKPPCDTMASNNVMDYNAMQHAWTPCQIGRIHANLSRETSLSRQLLEPRWRRLDPDQTITIRDSVDWKGAKDLEGNLVIEPGGVLQIHCRISMPAGARISVYPGATLVLHPQARLHNAFKESWQGIEVLEQGKRKGNIVFVGEPVVENVQERRP